MKCKGKKVSLYCCVLHTILGCFSHGNLIGNEKSSPISSSFFYTAAAAAVVFPLFLVYFCLRTKIERSKGSTKKKNVYYFHEELVY